MYILKNDELLDLIHDYVDFDNHLHPQDGLERLQNHKIRITKKLSYNHVHWPGITRIEDKFISYW